MTTSPPSSVAATTAAEDVPLIPFAHLPAQVGMLFAKLSKKGDFYRGIYELQKMEKYGILSLLDIVPEEGRHMEVRKLLIAEGTEEFRLALADALKGKYYVRSCREGNEAKELLHSFGPDILVLDLMLPGLDGISLLEQTADAGIRPMVLATTRLMSDYVVDSLERLGVGYVMLKPCDLKSTVDRITDLNQRLRQPLLTLPDPRTHVSNILLALGIPTKLRGYGYLREAVLLMARNPGQSITKELYPAVGARCSCAGTHVERSIRSAIAAAWNHRDEQIWRSYFPPDGDGNLQRPTNAAFICRLADSLQLSQEQER